MAALISETYRDQQQQLHESNPEYGMASVAYAPIVSMYCNKLEITSLLDYGCGKGRLFENLKVDHKMTLQAFDPAIPRFSEPPIPSQMVACIDVLEHIEPDHLDDLLDELQRLTLEVGIFSVSTCAARKVLADGRNAHLIQQPMEWWLPKLWERFDLQLMQKMDEHNFFVVVYARPRIEVASWQS
jgi:2-polyprenyl-3-methyl-5-hydroxy-6-metoxy-1,4-benzoquinol methylase